ncbi:MAG: type II secretion system protein [Oscillospiraceae bacterium]|nr:type II secretion system protein [Oscillospiraceae bacterium]
MKQNKNGFTLIELIVVVAILGVLMAVLVPQYIQYVQKSREAKAKQECSQVVGVANLELIDSYMNGTFSNISDTVTMSENEQFMNSVYETSNVEEDSIKALKASSATVSISYAEYVSDNDITVYYNGMIYSLEPLQTGEYYRLSALLADDEIQKLSGSARTQALQKAAQDENGNYTALTAEETKYIQQLVTDAKLKVLTEVTFDNLQWVPVASADGGDVMMVATNKMARTTGAVKTGYFIYYKGEYFYKAQFETGLNLGGTPYVSDNGTLSTSLDKIIAGGNGSDTLWTLFS